MEPEMSLDMEELNKRRIERHHRRMQKNAQKRRKKTLSMVAVCLLLIALGTTIFFLLRRGEKVEPEQDRVTQSDDVVSEKDTVIHLVAAGDVNITDDTVASGGEEQDYTKTFLDIAHLLAEGDITEIGRAHV